MKEKKLPLLASEIPKYIGKEIHIEYGDTHDKIIIGGVTTKYELAQREILDNGQTRAEIWEKNLPQSRITKYKQTKILMDIQGKDLYLTILPNGKICCQEDKKQIIYIH